MIFYCTTLINNYHKIGISSSLSGVKKRLTTYRSAAPNTKILFFTQINNAEELERSFKNKFDHFRIGRSECYNLRSDIILSHVLKFIHRDQVERVYKKDKFIKNRIYKPKRLFYIWRKDRLYLSNYYLDGGYMGLEFLSNLESIKNFKYQNPLNPIGSYELTDNEIYRWSRLTDFFPVCEIKEDYKRNKKGEVIEKSRKFTLFFSDLSSKRKFKDFLNKKEKFFEEYYKQKTYYSQEKLFNEFIKKNYKKKIFKESHIAASFAREFIYDCMKTNVPNLLKGYKFNKKTPEHENFYNNSHRTLKYSQKINHLFRNSSIRRSSYELERAIAKASYYPIDEFISSIKSLIDFPVMRFGVENEKTELIQRIRRVILKHKRDAFQIIEKLTNDFKNNK